MSKLKLAVNQRVRYKKIGNKHEWFGGIPDGMTGTVREIVPFIKGRVEYRVTWDKPIPFGKPHLPENSLDASQLSLTARYLEII